MVQNDVNYKFQREIFELFKCKNNLIPNSKNVKYPIFRY